MAYRKQLGKISKIMSASILRVACVVCCLWISASLSLVHAISISPVDGSTASKVCIASSGNVSIAVTATESEDHEKPSVSGTGWVEDSWDYPTLTGHIPQTSAGEFIISASDSGGAVSTTIKIVEVATLNGSSLEWQTNVLCVSLVSGDFFEAEALSNPALSDADLPGCWSLTPEQPNSSKHWTYVSLNTAGTYTISASAGSSSKNIELKLFGDGTTPTGVSGFTYPTPFTAVQNPDNGGNTEAGAPIVEITAYCANPVWRCQITVAEVQISQTIINPCIDPAPSSATSCAVLNVMETDLLNQVDAMAHTCTAYASTAAIQAHEDVHVSDIKAAFDTRFSALETAVEGITVSLIDYPSSTDATVAIMAAAASAWNTFWVGAETDINTSAAHDPETDFLNAQHSVIDSLISEIEIRRNTLNCP